MPHFISKEKAQMILKLFEEADRLGWTDTDPIAYIEADTVSVSNINDTKALVKRDGSDKIELVTR